MKKIIFCLFAVSGFSGLIYESIWANYLKLFLGHSSLAQSIVLILFMGGMAIGSYLAAKYSNKIKNPIKSYIIIEAMIGLFAISFHQTFLITNSFFYKLVLPYISIGIITDIIQYLLSGLIILPQAILLGATFPLITSGVIRLYPENSLKNISTLYFTNSIGGAIGILIAGYLLVGKLGLPGVSIFAGTLNILVAIIFTLVSINLNQDTTQNISVTYNMDKEELGKNKSSQNFTNILLTIALLTGIASFLYEMGWIRMLSLILGSSTHSFELMLSTFIFGLAIGSFYIRNHKGTITKLLKDLATIQIAMGVFALITIISYNHFFTIMSQIMSGVSKNDSGYFLYNLISNVLCFGLMFPTTFFAGMTLPLITHILMKNNYGEKSIGKVYSFNTIGAILGTLLALHIIMPKFGLKSVIGFGALIDLSIGIWLFYKHVENKKFIIAAGSVTTFAFVTLMFTNFNTSLMTSGVYRYGTISKDKNIVFYQDGKSASISLTKSQNKRTLATNGKPDASISLTNFPTGDEATQVLLAAIPISINPQIKTAAVIGLGSGMTSNTILELPNLKSLHTIEIEPAMVKAASLIGEKNNKTFEDNRSKIVINDAKKFFASYKNKFDLIISEPSNPWVSGVSSLFTTEFYNNIKDKLSSDGIFACWIHLYEITPELVASVINAIDQNFTDYHIYNTDENDIVILSSNKKINKYPTQEIFGNINLAKTLRYVGIKNFLDITDRYIGNKQTLGPYFKNITKKVNSDFNAFLDLNSVKARFKNQNAKVINNIRDSISYKNIKNHFYPDFAPETTIPSSLSVQSDKINQAKLIYNSILIGKTHEKVDEKIKMLVTTMANPKMACDKDYATTWLTGLHTLILNTYPYMSNNQMRTIFTKVMPSECLNNSDDYIKFWLAAYKGIIGERYDIAEFATSNILNIIKDKLENHAKAVKGESEINNILKPNDLKLIDNEYSLATELAMLANLRENNHQNALNIFRSNKISHPNNISFKYLLAIANSNIKLVNSNNSKSDTKG